MNTDERYEKLKEAILSWGDAYVEEFIGYTDDVKGMSREEKFELMDDAYSQMPDEKLDEFFQKFKV